MQDARIRRQDLEKVPYKIILMYLWINICKYFILLGSKKNKSKYLEKQII